MPTRQCPYCGANLSGTSKFCRGHHIKYRNQLVTRYRSTSNSSVRESTLRELTKYGWEAYIEDETPRGHAPRFRKFGVELEVILKNEAALNSISRDLNTYFNVNTESYNHRLSSSWKITTDGSLHPRNSCELGREFVSPPFTSEEGFEQIKRVCSTLSEYNTYVNKTCGFHVHIDASGMTAKHIARLLKLYTDFEGYIDTMHAPSRRGPNSYYCRTIDSLYLRASERATSVREIANSCSVRYCKVNLQAYLRHGTVEFRQHSGTINKNKIIHWVKFCMAMMDFAQSNKSWRTSDDLLSLLNLDEDEMTYWLGRIEYLRRTA